MAIAERIAEVRPFPFRLIPGRLESSRRSLIIGSLSSEADRTQAVELMKDGFPIAIEVRGVWGLLIDGSSAEAIRRAFETKGETPGSKPVSAMYLAPQFLDMVDLDKIPETLHPIFTTATTFAATFGTLCHLRVPVHERAVTDIPPVMLSRLNNTSYLHNLESSGLGPLKKLISQMNQCGILHPAVMSLNSEGNPEITDFGQARRFCSSKLDKVPLLLKDNLPHRPEVRGSFAILDMGQLTGIRDGQVPMKLIDLILHRACRISFDHGDMQPPHYPQADFPLDILVDLSPQAIRAGAILFIRGYGPEEIRNRLERSLL